MQGSIKSKLILCLFTVLMMAIAVAIPFSNNITRSFAALTGPQTIASGIVPSPTASPPHPTQTPEPAKWTIQEGIPYATLNGTTYKLNIYTSVPAPRGNAPIVLFFHGCCNPATNRDTALRLGKKPTDPHEYMFRALLNNGYLVASLDYPAQYPITNNYDAEAGKAAVRFLRAHAATYHIDSKRIIAWGSSGGGNPITIMGTADKSAGLDVGKYLKYSSRVEGVLDWYGDVNTQYVTSDDTPFLIQQGADDSNSLIKGSVRMYKALMAAHVFVQLQYVQNAGHQFSSRTGSSNPDYEGIAQTAITFLNAMVRDNPNPLPQ
jgi:acetyl esterase/lipase